ncbi:MAG: 5-formyltetrahydrofolate cyclo-ligase [Microbacteriaceae bacterium]
MTADVIVNQKRALRMELRARRNQLTATEKKDFRAGLSAQMIALATELKVRSLSCYLSAPDEPDTRGFLNWAFENGVEVLLPISREDGLLDWVVSDGQSEQPGLYGMPEPVGEILSPMAINSVDLILIPASAVDQSGVRMGWGRGYYDRTIGSMEARPPVYAVIFDNELLERVPKEDHDARVDGIVTPTLTLRFD